MTISFNATHTLAEKPFVRVRNGNPSIPIGLDINTTSIKEVFHRCMFLTVLYQGSAYIKSSASRGLSTFCLFRTKDSSRSDGPLRFEHLGFSLSMELAFEAEGIGEKIVRAERSNGQSNKILKPHISSM